MEGAVELPGHDVKQKLSDHSNKTNTQSQAEDGYKPKVKFICESCGMNENCHYKGRTPPFVSGKIQLREDSYIMRDPFSPPPPHSKPKAEYFLIIGSDCNKCGKTVCKDGSCSFFYALTYCLECVIEYMPTLPKEAQTKAKTQISNIKVQ